MTETTEREAVLNICASYHLRGFVDTERLHQALDVVASRHPVLHEELRPGWAEHDLSGLAGQAQRLRLEVLAQRDFRRPFELESESPLRMTAVRLGPDEMALLIAAHQRAWDDGSWSPFFADLTRAYTRPEGDGRAAAPAAERPCDQSEDDLNYWRPLLRELPEPLELPGPNGTSMPGHRRAQRVTRLLCTDTIGRVRSLARETGTTPYAVMLAAYAALLHRYTHTTDLVIAAPVSSSDTVSSIGSFAGTVPIRVNPKPRQTFRELVTQTADTATGALAHRNVDLTQLLDELGSSQEALTRVGFGILESDGGGFCPPGVQCSPGELHGQSSRLPLNVKVEPTDGRVEAEYLPEILDPSLAAQLLEHYAVLLDSALRDPGRELRRLTLFSDAEAEWMREVATGEQVSIPATTIAALVAERAAASPDNVAVVYEGRQYSYREINAEANRLAHWLIEQGIGAEDRVAVLLDKSPELVVTALAVLKCGAVYLPVDPTYPPERLSYILDDAQAKLALREPVTGLSRYPSEDPRPDQLVRPLRPENTAYLIYTSGSTGLPKGVPVPHRPIAEYFVWFGDKYQVDETDRLLQVASPGFDVSIAEIFCPLVCGARLVIPRPDGLRDINYLTELLYREGITSMHFVPSLLGLFLSLPGVNQWRTLRRVPIGGEPLPGEIADKFHATFDALLYNFYGPTETVVNTTSYQVEGNQGTRIVPIGRPKLNTQVYLLDDALQPVPVGVIGEIYIGGTHIAHGYHRRSALTAERFVADPFTAGARMYRSGDLARRNADGAVEFVGRADEQVKIRGFRIELGEIAAAISVDPSVGQTVVIAADLPHLGKSLVSYLTPADGDPGSVDVERIRTRVAAALPDYMNPAAYVVIDEIPITAHGKIDRNALPQPEITSEAEFREPTTDTERTVAALFTELLGAAQAGLDDSFFDLGGHSLAATKLVAAIRARCGVDIGIRDVFESETVGRLAQLIDRSEPATATGVRPALVRTSHKGRLPLSAAQLRSWFAYQIEGPSAVNNIPFVARLTGPCDLDALATAFSDLVGRHEILRTTYGEVAGVPHQVINAPAEVPVRQASGDGAAWLQEQLDSERRYRFELEHDWPIRAAVLHTGPGHREHVVSLVVHHIAIDHWSGGVLFADLLTAYRARKAGQEPAWAPLPVQYADFAAWQAELLTEPEDGSGIACAQRQYWERQLEGIPEDTGLRPDLPRPPVPSGAGDSVEFSIDSHTRAKLAGLCREVGVTEFMVLQAAVAVVLHKAGGGTDIPLGTPIASRTEPELDQLVGFFINILVLRNDLGGDPSLREVLSRVRDTALGAYAHQDLPFERVVDAVSPIRSLSRNPLFQVVVHVRDHLPAQQVIETGAGGDTVFTAMEPPFDIAPADLSVNFFAADAGYQGNIVYRSELYHRSTIERLVGWLLQVVNTFADDVDRRLRDVPLLDDRERRRILTDWSRGPEPRVDRPLTIAALLEPSRRWDSDRIALRCGDDQLDYPALHRRSDNFACLLGDLGVGPGSLVGLSTRRGIDMVVALVGIMKAGAGFFPLDPGYPAARKQLMLDDVSPRVVVATAAAAQSMPECPGATLLVLDDPGLQRALDLPAQPDSGLPAAHPDDPMYLVFTSGSTGKPKGVLGTHRAMTSRLNWQLWNYPVLGNDIRLAQASWTFLEGCMETLGGLAAGATTIQADDAEHRDPEALAALVRRHSVAQVTAVPSLVSTIVDAWPESLSSLHRLVCGAEPMTAALHQRLLANYGGGDGPELLNNFGATETSGALVRGPLATPVPLLGVPMPGSQVYLLDDALKPVPVGVVGELYYAGAQLVRGYWKRPGLTASRFVPNPYSNEPGARFYRSGDRARWTEDGCLEFVGRADHQVKVRGFRVELGEVEAALKGVDGVAVAAVRTWDVDGSTTLAGYVAPRELVTGEAEKAEFATLVRDQAASVLPGYMMPSSITVLDVMPKTESGKLNRPGLPKPAVSTRGRSEPPRTDTERALAEVFVGLLPIDEIGVRDDFFVLGGDSILSVQLAARARDAGLAVSPRMVFEHPTVQQLAAALDSGADGTRADDDVRHEPMSTSGLSEQDLAAVTAAWATGGGNP
ncbi:amino acid adenylation domain-containing protein [Mycobacterium sp. 23]|uniref:amino acid adenylation domain-containing protein n=1 Tax=Mycobacterium sp. 23 TaxID=3400424 RepID=UPI003AB0F9D3